MYVYINTNFRERNLLQVSRFRAVSDQQEIPFQSDFHLNLHKCSKECQCTIYTNQQVYDNMLTAIEHHTFSTDLPSTLLELLFSYDYLL